MRRNWLRFLSSLHNWLKHFVEWNLGFLSTTRIGISINHWGSEILVIQLCGSPALELWCASTAVLTWGPEQVSLLGHTVHDSSMQGSSVILHRFVLCRVDNPSGCIRGISTSANLMTVLEVHLSSVSQWSALLSQEKEWEELTAQLSEILPEAAQQKPDPTYRSLWWCRSISVSSSVGSWERKAERKAEK